MGMTGARRWLVGTLSAGMVATLVPLQTGCTTNPTTGRRQFQALSRDQEIQIGAEQGPALTQEFGGAVRDPALQRYMADIGQRMAAVTEADNPSLPWEFTLLDSDVINAFALPGGKVFISRGLAEQMTNEAQFAGVIGHEIGHVTARHTNDRMTQQIGLGVGGAVAGIILGEVTGSDTIRQVGPGAGMAIGQIAAMSYGRDQELEADYLGMRYMSSVGYNPAAQGQVMEILMRASAGRGGIEFLSTHPHPETRINRINTLLQGEFAHTQNNPQFQFYEERYRQQFLGRLALMPAPTHIATRDGFGPTATFVLGDPSTWCAHCAAEKGKTECGTP